VIIDNMSAGFDVSDEQSNAVVKQKVVKPILEFIASTNTLLVLVHHAGKSNENANYGGRGASVLEDLAPVNFVIKGNAGKGHPMEITCSKRKDGPDYTETFTLDKQTRWLKKSFHVAPKQYSLEDEVRSFVCSETFPALVPAADIYKKFGGIAKATKIKMVLKDLLDFGQIFSPSRGKYCAPLVVDPNGHNGRPPKGTTETTEDSQDGQNGQATETTKTTEGEGVCKCGIGGRAGERCSACGGRYE
jgi:hypothetical protein